MLSVKTVCWKTNLNLMLASKVKFYFGIELSKGDKMPKQTFYCDMKCLLCFINLKIKIQQETMYFRLK